MIFSSVCYICQGLFFLSQKQEKYLRQSTVLGTHESSQRPWPAACYVDPGWFQTYRDTSDFDLPTGLKHEPLCLARIPNFLLPVNGTPFKRFTHAEGTGSKCG